MKKVENKKVVAIEEALNEIKNILSDALDSELEFSKVYTKVANVKDKLLVLQEKVYAIKPESTSAADLEKIKDALNGFIDWYVGEDADGHYAKKLFDNHTFSREQQVVLYSDDGSDSELHNVEFAVADIEKSIEVKENMKKNHANYIKKSGIKTKIKRVAAAILAVAAIAGTTFGIVNGVRYNNEKKRADGLEDQIKQYEEIQDQAVALTKESRDKICNFLKEVYPEEAENIEKYSDIELVSKYVQATQDAINNLKNELNGKDLTIEEKSQKIQELENQIKEWENKNLALNTESREFLADSVMGLGYSREQIKAMSDKEVIELYVELQKTLDDTQMPQLPDDSENNEIDESDPEKPIENDVYDKLNEEKPEKPTEEDSEMTDESKPEKPSGEVVDAANESKPEKPIEDEDIYGKGL